MDGVGKMGGPKPGAALFKEFFETGFPVDAHMPAIGRVIVAGELPADFFRKIAGHTDHQAAAGFEHAKEFFCGLSVLRDMLHDLRADHQVECVVGKGKPGDIPCSHCPAAPAMGADSLVIPEPLPCLAHIGEASVHAHHGDVFHFKDPAGMPPAAAPNVQNPVAR